MYEIKCQEERPDFYNKTLINTLHDNQASLHDVIST
jgi:hypothetical protein